MQTILVTGANGLLGSHLVPLLAETANVHVLTRQAPVAPSPRVTYHPVDLAGSPDYAALPARIDAVLYLAQSRRFREFPDSAPEVFDVNVRQVVRLLDHARRAGARSFVYASSGGVYGTAPTPFTEDAPIAEGAGRGFYLATKMCGEAAVREFAGQLDVAILRPFFIYGAGQSRDMLIPRLIDNVRAGVPLGLQAPDGMRINPVHAADAARAFAAAIDLRGLNVVNVAGPEALSLREIGGIIGRKTGVAPRFDLVPGSTAGDLIGDTTRMAELLSAPSIRFESGIEDLL